MLVGSCPLCSCPVRGYRLLESRQVYERVSALEDESAGMRAQLKRFSRRVSFARHIVELERKRQQTVGRDCALPRHFLGSFPRHAKVSQIIRSLHDAGTTSTSYGSRLSSRCTRSLAAVSHATLFPSPPPHRRSTLLVLWVPTLDRSRILLYNHNRRLFLRMYSFAHAHRGFCASAHASLGIRCGIWW